MNTSSWIRFKPVRARQLYTALALGLTLIGIQGCGGPQKSAQESQSTTVQSPTPTGQVPSAPIPKLTPVPGSVVGLVLGGGAPIANATVTLWAASTGEPKQLGQTQTSADGRFELRLGGGSDKDTSLYLIAKGGEPTGSAVKGDNPAIALITVLGSNPPSVVTINEMTTVASVWTNNQFLNGTAISGTALGLRIAAGNVPNSGALRGARVSQFHGDKKVNITLHYCGGLDATTPRSTMLSPFLREGTALT